MKKILLFLFILLSTSPLFCQRKSFTFGLQSGVNYNSTYILTEFENSSVRGDFFLGSSFGLTARNKLFKYKFQWGGFFNHFYVFAEYGLGYSYGAYNYYYKDESILQDHLSFQVPFLFVFRPAFPKYWYKSFKGKRIYPIVKTGFIAQTTRGNNSQKRFTFGEAEIIENVTVDPKINFLFKSALGFQKEYKNGKILYAGISAHTPIFKRISGTVEIIDAQGSEINNLFKTDLFFSLDLQYFFGEKSYDLSKRRKRRFGKLPKIIYNPRY